MPSAGEKPPRSGSGRGAAVWVEDVLIWASLVALWPHLLRGRWIFTGWWVTALLWAALAAMLAVLIRRLLRLSPRPTETGQKEPHRAD